MEALKADQPASESLLEKTLDSLEFYILIIFLALLPLSFTPFAYDFFNISKITLIRLTGLLLLASLSVKLIFNKKIKIPKSLLFYSIMGYFLTIAISSAFSIDLSTSLLGLRKRYFGLLTYVPIFIITYTVWIKKINAERQRKLISIITVSALITSIVGIFQVFGSTFPMDLKSFFGSSAYSTIGNPNLLGIYLNLVLPLCLAMAISHKNIFGKAAFGLSALIIFIGVLATNSSGAIFASLISIILFALFYINKEIKNNLQKLLGFVVVILVFTGSFLFFLNVSSKTESASWQSRIPTWKASILLMVENPIHGVGPDTMRYALPGAKDIYSSADKETFEDAHNIFLTTGSTAGIPALALFVAVIILFGIRCKKSATQYGSDFIYTAFFISVVSYLIAEQVNPDHIVTLTVFWFFVAIVGSRGESFAEIQFPKLPSIFLGIATFLISISLLILNNFPLLAEIQLLKAQQAVNIQEAYTYYNKAQTYNPYYDIYWHNFAERIFPLIKTDDQTTNFAISSAVEATRVSPLERDNYALLGDIYKKLGENTSNRDYLKKAVYYYSKALSMDKFDLEVMYNLAFTYEKLGDTAKAIKTANLYLNMEDDAQIRTLKKNLEKK